MCWANQRQGQSFRDCQKRGERPERTFKAKHIGCKEPRRRGRCHTKSSCHGDSPGQSPATEMSRARLQILIPRKSILGNRDHGKGVAPSHGQGTTAQNLCETPLWSYTGCARDLDKVWGLLSEFGAFGMHAILFSPGHFPAAGTCHRPSPESAPWPIHACRSAVCCAR